MGMRRNIELKYDNGKKIYFYTHWGAETIKDEIKNALSRRARWNDHSYLARIIFSEMISNDVNGETGFGIAPYVMDDEYKTIKMDLKKQTVDGIPYEEFIEMDWSEDDTL